MNESYLPWANYTNPAFVQQPTPSQLAGLVADAQAWTLANRHATNGLVLISAWNEYAEGHWIAPTLPQFEGAARLQAIAAVLNNNTDDTAT